MESILGGNTVEICLIMALIAIIFSVFTFVMYLNQNKRLENLFSGRKSESLEELIIEANTNSKKAINSGDIFFERLKKIENKFEKSFTKSSLIRYNPFKDDGGNQSFSLCLLDYHNTGVIISALYHRGSSNIYIREIKEGEPSSNLSEEEMKVYRKAQEA